MTCKVFLSLINTIKRKCVNPRKTKNLFRQISDKCGDIEFIEHKLRGNV
jgi:hypothetical protein